MKAVRFIQPVTSWGMQLRSLWRQVSQEADLPRRRRDRERLQHIRLSRMELLTMFLLLLFLLLAIALGVYAGVTYKGKIIEVLRHPELRHGDFEKG